MVYAGDILDVKTADEETLVLPCKVSRPDVDVFLFKETPNVRPNTRFSGV